MRLITKLLQSCICQTESSNISSITQQSLPLTSTCDHNSPVILVEYLLLPESASSDCLDLGIIPSNSISQTICEIPEQASIEAISKRS